MASSKRICFRGYIMKTEKDYYKVLEVDENASKEDIKKVYRQKAQEYHPDRNKGSKDKEDKFKEISEAYSVLSDEDKRKEYDQMRKYGSHFKGGGFEGFKNPFNSSNFKGFKGYEDIFRKNNHDQNHYDLDINGKIPITYYEAINGVSKEVGFSQINVCEECSGKGSKSDDSVAMCKQCKGSGIVIMQRSNMMIQTTCHACNGKGSFIADPCNKCDGKGLYRKNQKLTVKVPPNSHMGKILRCKESGHVNKKGEKGNINLSVVYVRNNNFSQQNEYDIVLKFPIPLHIAVNGGDVDIPTLHGNVTEKIKKGTNNGDSLVIKNKGLPKNEKKYGDLTVLFIIEIPKNISKEFEDFLNKLDINEKNYPNYTKKLKEINNEQV